MSAPKIRYHVNVRAALILAAIGLTTALGLSILWRYQEERILKIALQQVKAFQEEADKAEKVDDQDQKSHKNELALRHLTHYLEARPDDAEALDIEAKLRLEANDRRGAAEVYAHLIRVEGALGQEQKQDSARGYDLRLMSWRDGSGVSTSANNLVIVGADNHGLLHIRIFDAGGNRITDADETKLSPTQTGAISTLKQQLPGLLPPHELTSAEKVQVLSEVTSIVGQTRARVQAARRRLAEIDIEISDFTRNSLQAKLMPEQASKHYRYHSAEQHAKNLLEVDSKDAKAHLLYAMALEGQIVSGQSSELRGAVVALLGKHNIASVEDGAILEYENALELMANEAREHKQMDEKARKERDRDEIVAAMRLAGLYQKASRKTTADNESFVNSLFEAPSAANRLFDLYLGLRKNTDIAKEVLDKLLKIRDSVDVRTNRYAFFSNIGDLQAAAAELEEAILLDPENLTLILVAAENAMRLGPAGTRAPHFWLAQVPGSLRDDSRVLMVLGMVQYTEQNYKAALATWRKGLRANRRDVGLCQRLALVLLDLGRDDEAKDIIEQYRGLVANKTDPVLRFLEAIQDEHAGRFSPAIEKLESARGQLPESFQTHVHLILARCQEKQGDSSAAAKTYRAGLGFDPKSLVLRQFLGQLLLATRPEEAAREFEQGLFYRPNQPAFLVGLAEARLQEQMALPQERRNWVNFDTVFKRATPVLSSGIALTLLKAERLAADDQVDRAISFLKEEIDKQGKAAATLRKDVAELKKDVAELKKDVAKDPTNPELQNQLEEREVQLEEREVQLEMIASGLAGCAGRLADYHRGQGPQGVEKALKVLKDASDPTAAGDRGSLRVKRAALLTSQSLGHEARDVLLQNVDKIPVNDRDEVWTHLFLLCRSQGDPKTTRATYDEWARLLPDDPRPKFALLEMDIEANDQNAIRDRLKSLQTHNDRGDLMLRLVQARLRLIEAEKAPTEEDRRRLLKDADSLVEVVLKDFKIDTLALVLKGRILEKEGAPEKAAEFYNQAWARGNVDALIRLVDIWTRLGRKPELDRLRQNDKTKQIDEIVAKFYLSRGDKSEAAKITRQSLAENPGRPSWQVGILEYLGKNEEAEASLRTLAERQPDKLEPWLALARFHATPRRAQATTNVDRRHRVEAILEEIKPLLKDRGPDELIEADCRFAAADWPAADQAYDTARKRYPDDPKVQARVKRYQAQKEDLDEAEKCLSDLKAEANIARFTPLLKVVWPDELIDAECRFAAADWLAADKAFKEAGERYPQLPEVKEAVKRYQASKGRPDAAEACLRHLEAEAAIATEIKPRLKNRWPVELLAAECRFAAADWPAADKAFEEAIKRYPQLPEVKEAVKRYQEASKGRPDAAEACLRRLKIEATIVEAKQRVKLRWPELIDAQCRRAVADWPAADKAFDAAVERYPDVRDVQAAAAQYYEQRGRLDDAERCLRGILKHTPAERDAVLELAIVLSGQSDRPDARKEALDLLGKETKTKIPEERLVRAIVLGRSGELSLLNEAISILQELVADIPAASPMALTAREMLPQFLLAAGQADQASKLAGVAAAKGQNPAAIALYAETLLQSRQLNAAEEQRKRLEQLDPANPLIASLRARLIRARSKPTEAAAALERGYLDLVKENSPYAEQFGREAFPMILGLGPDAQGVAEALGDRLAERNPALSWMKASILANRGKRTEALALSQTAVQANMTKTGTTPSDVILACRIAMDVVGAARAEPTVVKQAEEIIETALQRLPEADELLVMKAMIAHVQSRFDEELHLYRTVLSRKPQLEVALNNIAWLLSEGLHKPAEGLEKIDELIQLTHRTPNNADTRGVILMRLDRLDEAIDELKWVVQAEPSNVHYYHLARAYKKMGRDADFHKAFEEAKRADLTAAVLDPTERADFEDLLKP